MHNAIPVPVSPIPATRNQSTDLTMVRILGRWIHSWCVALCRSSGDVPHSEEVAMAAKKCDCPTDRREAHWAWSDCEVAGHEEGCYVVECRVCGLYSSDCDDSWKEVSV